MTKLLFAVTAMVISIIYAAIALCDHNIAQDVGIVYLAVLMTLLVLAHGRGTNGHA